MKNYVCAILLLMCVGLSYSAMQVRKSALDGCSYRGIIIEFGTSEHFHPCVEVFCNWNGSVSITMCPERVYCKPPYQLIGIISADYNRRYPYCCEQLVCQKP